MTERHVTLTAWEPHLDWAAAEPVAYADVHVPDAPERRYAARSWVSPVVESAFAATELVPSWNACTPAGAWLLVEGRVADDDGWSPWFVFARWADDDPDGAGAIVRTTVPDQRLPHGRVDADTFRSADGRGFTRWQLRLTGLATDPALGFPEVRLVTGAAAHFDIGPDEPTSAPAHPGRELAVPPLSQRLHVDTFPQWDRGGQSWCSPTSTTMLLTYWGLAPSADESRWVGHGTDPGVVHGVRRVFDADYEGAGNWAFNTAYAATRGLRAYVTRLRDLTEAEAFVAAGVPLVVSATFTEDELDGAGYDTRGHLLTIVGFTDAGDVVSNDPNSHRIPSNEQVRVVYRRDQFEKVWLGRDGGLAYVMHPHDVALPEPPAEANWA